MQRASGKFLTACLIFTDNITPSYSRGLNPIKLEHFKSFQTIIKSGAQCLIGANHRSKEGEWVWDNSFSLRNKMRG